ncbi:phosphoribosyltransferase family protein [Paraburkholderia sp. GAS41]|uniref:phosphoribosyltransferase family protein n=1 Tax=Paraburkholderia sp. GAS41 TaxID=3035134 RepID=UPI003D1B3AC0
MRTIDDLNSSILARLSDFRDVDCVVGVPRSGFVPASILALNLNVPLVHLHDFLAGDTTQTYTRRIGDKHAKLESAGHNVLKVLIVDDATSNGVTFGDIRKKFSERGLDQRFDIQYMAAYCTPSGRQHVDRFLEEVPTPRVFEWNLMHHVNTQFYCVDLDGVLCDDPTVDENDDGPGYEQFCLNARPKFVPTVPVGAIVTARLEKYRPQTEDWLKRNGVVYRRLVMCNLPTGAERRRLKAHAAMKADVYKTLGGMLFVESDPEQARTIHLATGKPVFCFGKGLVTATGQEDNQIAALLMKISRQDQLIHAMSQSSSWRITAPLRRLVSVWQRLVS